MQLKEFLQQNTVVLDGGTGTLLQQAGLPLGELPERWNITHAEIITDIHRAYFDAGAHIVCTNTFGANLLKFSAIELEEIISSAIANAKRGARLSTGKQPKFVALDIGPSGRLLKPYGDFSFEEAVALFAETVKLGVQYGADLVLIETMGDSYETKAAVLAVKENCNLPVFVSNAYGGDGKLMTGATPEAMVAMLEGLGVDALGANCSLGPKQLAPIIETLLEKSSIPVLVKPNAGLPQTDGERTYYDVDEKEFASEIKKLVEKGARLVGGCCGTTPAYIKETAKAVAGLAPLPVLDKNITCVSSYTHAVEFDKPLLIGERINPTGKKRFKQALINGETEYALNEALAQKENGAHILDVNVGLPDIDEVAVLTEYIEKIQAVVDLPLQIDTANPIALERALRIYNGKPLINSVNGKKESMDAVFPLVKKYGGAVVALTLDENGIPDTWQGRVAIAEKIVKEAEKYGIRKKDIFVDTLTMSAATDKNAGRTTLNALRFVSKEMGLHTVLGVSNISFGLPSRETVNGAFFTLALENGLSAGIINPSSAELQKAYHAYLALNGKDENCAEYIRFATEKLPAFTQPNTASLSALPTNKEGSPLQSAIKKGLKEQAFTLCKSLLKEKKPLAIINEEIVPALDEIGKAYEEKRAYLPQLLTSAESAKNAFEAIKEYLSANGETQMKKCKFVLATVKGDIHDIGKNIVKTLLENYGFAVIDLGRDVSPERLLEAVQTHNAPLVGLSALMTTTVPSMAETVALLKTHAPACKIIVGGAVLNEEYARKIGADAYGKDGMETVRYAESVYVNLCKNK